MSDKPCAVPDCDKPARGRGWCATHYARWRRHLDLSAGKQIFRIPSPGYSTRHSRVKRLRGSASAQPCQGGCGNQARDWATVHDRDGLDVFADYIPLCARCHQRYDGQTEHRARGSAVPASKLVEAQVAEIKAALRAGRTVVTVAREYGRHWATINSIKAGRTWRHVS